MRIEKKVDITAKDKAAVISRTLKTEPNRELEAVEIYSKKTIKLIFSEKKSYITNKKVIQFSKGKIDCKEKVVEKIESEKDSKNARSLWRKILVVELPEVWLAFCQRRS